jgi:hypothetical protein
MPKMLSSKKDVITLYMHRGSFSYYTQEEEISAIHQVRYIQGF